MSAARSLGAAGRSLAAALALLAAGCATLPPQGPPPGAPASGQSTAAETPVGHTASGGTIVTRAPGAVAQDSLPSSEAVAVLQSIPEPLPPEERVPAPARPATGIVVGGGDSTTAAQDRARAESASGAEGGADSTRGEVPVPAPTEPLGDRPGTLERLTAPDTVHRAAAGAPPMPAPAVPDTCWRVQIAAPAERGRAERLRDAAASQLLIAVVIERERGRFKIRTRECMSREAADQLKQRAVATGFRGVFRFKGARR